MEMLTLEKETRTESFDLECECGDRNIHTHAQRTRI